MTTTEWISVGALGDAFAADNHCLPQVQDLAGKTLCLNFENGWVIDHTFTDDQQLVWAMTGAEGEQASGRDRYTVTRPRPGIYFVDFIKRSERATSVSLVLDLQQQVFVAVIAELPTADEAHQPLLSRIAAGQELTAVQATFLRGTIDRPWSTDCAAPQTTTELLGKRIAYRYSPHELYEHIYLNDGFYTWRCIQGSERGLADTDACHYYRIADQLYLFVWREKIVPTLGVIMIDLQAMKTTGKIVGYETNSCEQLRNFTVGAHARVLAEIEAQ